MPWFLPDSDLAPIIMRAGEEGDSQQHPQQNLIHVDVLTVDFCEISSAGTLVIPQLGHPLLRNYEEVRITLNKLVKHETTPSDLSFFIHDLNS